MTYEEILNNLGTATVFFYVDKNNIKKRSFEEYNAVVKQGVYLLLKSSRALTKGSGLRVENCAGSMEAAVKKFEELAKDE